MVSGLSMIAVVTLVHSLTILLLLFTLGAACTSCGGLVALLNFTVLVKCLSAIGMLLRSSSIFC
jgi:hypothetical protein